MGWSDGLGKGISFGAKGMKQVEDKGTVTRLDQRLTGNHACPSLHAVLWSLDFILELTENIQLQSNRVRCVFQWADFTDGIKDWDGGGIGSQTGRRYVWKVRKKE